MITEIILIGFILSTDSFSAALAMGLRPHTKSDSFRFALLSGSAEAIVAYIGSIVGAKVVAQFSAIDHWVAFCLLMLVAIHMFIESWTSQQEQSTQSNIKFHHISKLLLVSFATSIDALGVGVSIGVVHKESLLPFIVSIGVWAFMATMAGMSVSKLIPKKYSRYLGVFSSIILILLAFKMLEI